MSIPHGGLAPWLGEFVRAPRRSFVTPVQAAALWHPDLRDPGFPAPVRPLHRLGLLRACDDVLPVDQRQRARAEPGPPSTGSEIGTPTEAQVARLQALVGLVPYATVPPSPAPSHRGR